MTHEEMIEQLENTILLIQQNGKDWWDERDIPILEEAIKAMKTKTCEDCISRQAAIDTAIEAADKWDGGFSVERSRIIIEALNDLPSVTPQKGGKWIPVSSYEAFGGDEITWSIHGNPIAYHYCSECKVQTRVNEFGEEILSKYCPDCGARMLKEGE